MYCSVLKFSFKLILLYCYEFLQILKQLQFEFTYNEESDSSNESSSENGSNEQSEEESDHDSEKEKKESKRIKKETKEKIATYYMP